MSNGVAASVQGDRRRERFWIALGAALILSALAVVGIRATSRPAMPPTCAIRYAEARSSQDTALVDALTPPGKFMDRCGVYRRIVERRRHN
jgi:hypothetical protein